MKYFYTALLLMGALIASAQPIYRKASVTTNDGKTLTGYISIHNWGKNPKYVEFKSNPNDTDIKRFFPVTITSFVINGYAQYITYSGRLSTNPTRISKLPDGKDTTSVNEAIFLKQIATGDNVTLYSYADKIKERFFIKEKQSEPYELLYQQYYDKLHNTHTVKQYSGQLNVLVLRYTDSVENLKNIAYYTLQCI